VNEAAQALVGRRVVVEVPASIANLGAGYDCLGLAIDLPLVVAVEPRLDRDPGHARAFDLQVEGEGAGELDAGDGNRFLEAFEAGLAAMGLADLDGIDWRIEMTNPIPLGRGLGSSAAATIGGLLAAVVLGHPAGVLGAEFDGLLALPGSELRARLLALATRIEGHPDNVAPALLGGFVAAAALESAAPLDGSAAPEAAAALDAEVEAFRFDVPADLRVVLFIPELRLATAEMRRVLPAAVPRADAVANLARVAVGVAGIASGHWDALRFLLEDRLHEPYRAAVYPQLPGLVAAARGVGALGACLAGAGSTIAAFTTGGRDAVDAIGAALIGAAARGSLPGRVVVVAPRSRGAAVLADR
jgi:homoserine kinase